MSSNVKLGFCFAAFMFVVGVFIFISQPRNINENVSTQAKEVSSVTNSNISTTPVEIAEAEETTATNTTPKANTASANSNTANANSQSNAKTNANVSNSNKANLSPVPKTEKVAPATTPAIVEQKVLPIADNNVIHSERDNFFRVSGNIGDQLYKYDAKGNFLSFIDQTNGKKTTNDKKLLPQAKQVFTQLASKYEIKKQNAPSTKPVQKKAPLKPPPAKLKLNKKGLLEA